MVNISNTHNTPATARAEQPLSTEPQKLINFFQRSNQAVALPRVQPSEARLSQAPSEKRGLLEKLGLAKQSHSSIETKKALVEVGVSGADLKSYQTALKKQAKALDAGAVLGDLLPEQGQQAVKSKIALIGKILSKDAAQPSKADVKAIAAEAKVFLQKNADGKKAIKAEKYQQQSDHAHFVRNNQKLARAQRHKPYFPK